MAETSREIDWQSVEVRDGNVLVMLTGAASKQWGEHFQVVLKLLTQGNTPWGEVSLGKKGIKVEALQPGAEDDLRHLLESVVMQVNTTGPRRQEDGRDAKGVWRARATVGRLCPEFTASRHRCLHG
jgi:hypothetical protein